jgi:hypothetical protein
MGQKLPRRGQSGMSALRPIAAAAVADRRGRLRVGKENVHVAGLVGAAMCSAFECGPHDRWP